MADLNLDIKSLETLLNIKDANSDEEDEPVKNASAKLGPGSIGPKKKESSETTDKKSIYDKVKTKDIWNADEVDEGAEYDTSDDPRIQPEYEILYKQKITSEEIFLQMGNKTPATSSCEDMVVKIKLPGISKITEIDLNVYEKFLDCRTSQYRLGLHLPHPVDNKNSNAKWDPKNSTLIITMTLNREFDFVNF